MSLALPCIFFLLLIPLLFFEGFGGTFARLRECRKQTPNYRESLENKHENAAWYQKRSQANGQTTPHLMSSCQTLYGRFFGSLTLFFFYYFGPDVLTISLITSVGCKILDFKCCVGRNTKTEPQNAKSTCKNCKVLIYSFCMLLFLCKFDPILFLLKPT